MATDEVPEDLKDKNDQPAGKKDQPAGKKGAADKNIHIEVCANCRSHAWCTRHKEQKYNQFAEETKAAILADCPGYTVEINAITNVPRIGAFEVSHGENVIFSKLNSGLWPNPKVLARDVKGYLDALAGGQPTQKYIVRGADINTKKAAPKANMSASMSPHRSVMVGNTSQVAKDDIMTKTAPVAKTNVKEEGKINPPRKEEAQPKEESKVHPPKKEESQPKEVPKKEEAQPKEESKVHPKNEEPAPEVTKVEAKPAEDPHPTPGQPAQDNEKKQDPPSPEKPKDEQPPPAEPVEQPKPVEAGAA